jgi:hypothetical protein
MAFRLVGLYSAYLQLVSLLNANNFDEFLKGFVTMGNWGG